MKIENFEIGREKTFIIAEAGVNHNGDIDLAKQLIDVAKDSGADAVKFQTFKAERLNTKTAPKATYHIETTGNSQSWLDLLKSQELSREDHKILIKYCEEKQILFLSTPYDNESVDLLCELGVQGFKIASTDANNLPFLDYIARKGLPMILSTGMCTEEEVIESVETIKKTGNTNLALLQCTSNYPAPDEDTNLRVMNEYQRKFDVPVGYSDHTKSNMITVAAIAAGASIYEKHFTIDRELPGPDHRSSLEPDELREMVELIRKAEMWLGSPVKAVAKSEVENREKLRKSVVANASIAKGEFVSERHLTLKRPGTGLPPKFLPKLVNMRAKMDIPEDTVVSREMFDL